jgi:hypothetical protein
MVVAETEPQETGTELDARRLPSAEQLQKVLRKLAEFQLTLAIDHGRSQQRVQFLSMAVTEEFRVVNKVGTS